MYVLNYHWALNGLPVRLEGTNLEPSFLPKVVRAVDAAEAWVARRMVSEMLDRPLRLAVRKRRAQGVQSLGVSPRPESGWGRLA